jgi:uncharacterized HAD superfamily protein
MKICLDLDDTIANTQEKILEFAIKYDREYLKRPGIINREIDCDDYFYFARLLGWNSEDTKGFFDKYYLEFLPVISPNKNVQSAIMQLKEMGHSIHILSARKEIGEGRIYKITIEWLESNEIYYDNLTINRRNKLNTIIENNYDIFVDDGFKNCLEIVSKVKIPVFMIKTLYNKNLKDDSIIVIEDLYELVQYIKDFNCTSNSQILW